MQRSILLTAVFALISLPAAATVHHVPSTYGTIQKAMDAASPGDTVLVDPGTYADCTHKSEEPRGALACVIMKSGVVLLGSGAEVTTIDAKLEGMGIYCKNVTSGVIEGFTIINADDLKGGWDYAPAIFCRASSPDVRDCELGPNFDGGMFCTESSAPTVTLCILKGNDAKSGGGIHMEFSSDATVRDCEISDNTAPIGAGFYVSASDPLIEGCDVLGNVAGAGGNGGGFLIKDLSDPTIRDCLVSGNRTANNGAGFCFIESSGRVVSCTLRDNEVTGDGGQGGGVCFLTYSTTTLDSCVIVRNTTSGDYSDGGGVYCKTSDVTITQCTVAHNSVAPPLDRGSGGGISAYNCSPTIENTIVAFATVGAGLDCPSGGDPQVSCCDVFGNQGGDAICGTDGGGNFSADPVFCDTTDYNYALDHTSPCAPGNHPSGPGTCGDALIGALPVACYSAVEDEGIRIERNPLFATTAPNPFNLSTTVEFALTDPARVTLRIYDVTGREVAALSDCPMSIGTHRVTWDGTTRGGSRASSGIYFYRLTVGDRSHTGRMVMVN